MVVAFDFLASDRFAVHRTPRIPDISHDERNEDRYDTHRFKREEARGAVVDGQ